MNKQLGEKPDPKKVVRYYQPGSRVLVYDVRKSDDTRRMANFILKLARTGKPRRILNQRQKRKAARQNM